MSGDSHTFLVTDADLDIYDLSRYFAGLLVVLGLLVGIMILIRKGWVPAGLTGFYPGARTHRRLQITETLILDPRRRVVIVKCDETEHVVLLGPERETILDKHAARQAEVFEPEFPHQDNTQDNTEIEPECEIEPHSETELERAAKEPVS